MNSLRRMGSSETEFEPNSAAHRALKAAIETCDELTETLSEDTRILSEDAEQVRRDVRDTIASAYQLYVEVFRKGLSLQHVDMHTPDPSEALEELRTVWLQGSKSIIRWDQRPSDDLFDSDELLNALAQGKI